MTNLNLQPIVKWAGGKRQLLQNIIPYFPTSYDTYFEPFVGGGAVLLTISPEKAVINDLNKELINVYAVVRDQAEALIDCLANHKVHHCTDYYYTIRALDRDSETFIALSDVERAARTIYLNRTCYNGLFRVNKEGNFNTPIGRYVNPKIVDEYNIRALSTYLRQANIKICSDDYTKSLAGIQKDDLVYFDPPYQPLAPTSNFTRYTKEGFGITEQERLKEICDTLTERGIRFLQSNANVPQIRELYKDYVKVSFSAYRWINSKAAERWAGVGELLIRNFD